MTSSARDVQVVGEPGPSTRLFLYVSKRHPSPSETIYDILIGPVNVTVLKDSRPFWSMPLEQVTNKNVTRLLAGANLTFGFPMLDVDVVGAFLRRMLSGKPVDPVYHISRLVMTDAYPANEIAFNVDRLRFTQKRQYG